MSLCIMQCMQVDILPSILEQPMDTMDLGTMDWDTIELDTMGWVLVIMGWITLDLEWGIMVWDTIQWVWDTMDLGSMMTQVTTA